ncbi:MAG: hypothetical protein Q7T19_05215 [Caulobacter sp.]|nr:hypothetical protein [Caulobacter sp.]
MSRIGSATYRFNTILVGLESVAAERGDAGAIAVSWTKPNGPAQAKNAATQARSFACAGAIVLAADVFDSYIREVAEEDWLSFDNDVVDIATKAITRPKEKGGAYSVAERAMALSEDVGVDDLTSIALIDLFSKWRNVVAHSSDRNPKIDSNSRHVLLEQSGQISKSHAHLRVDLAIRNFESRAVPVPKEVTSLVANAVRFAKSIDEAAVRRVSSTTQEIEDVAEALLRRFFLKRGATSARSIVADLWQGEESRRFMGLIKLMGSLGISESSKPISAVLRANYVSELCALTRDQFEHRYLIP